MLWCPIYRGLLSEFVYGGAAYRLSALVCVSKFLEQEVLTQHAGQILVRRIPYGVPLPQRQALPPAEKLRLAYVCRLVEQQKRISEVTRALCRAISQVVNTEAVIYGEGPARPAIEQILREQAEGLPVHIKGRVDSDQMQERLLECHALVLLSDYEGLPIALMEAMAVGLPVAATDIPGIREAVGPAGYEHLAPVGDPDTLAKRILHFALDAQLRHEVGAANRARIARFFSPERMCRTAADVLSRCLQAT